QRADHHCPGAARAARCEVSPAERGGDAASKSPHLRARRHRRAVSGHLDHRSAPRTLPSCVRLVMWSPIVPAFRITLVLTVLTGLVYPTVVTGVAQVIFPRQAHGSLVTIDGKVIGSEFIGQNFARPEYFHPRPSAAGKDGYDATASSGSNYGPTNQKLIER